MVDVHEEELNLNGFDGPFTGQVGNFQDYSRDFLVKLVRVYDDCLLFAYHAWATALAKHVGEEQLPSRGDGGICFSARCSAGYPLAAHRFEVRRGRGVLCVDILQEGSKEPTDKAPTCHSPCGTCKV